MVYLKYNKVKLPAFDDYSIVKSSQEITFSDLKCDFDGYTKEDLPEKYQEVKVVEEQKMNQQVEEIECEEKQKVKELTFVSEVNKPITIKKIYGYSAQSTRSGKNKFNLSYIRPVSVFEVTDTGLNLKNCWTADIYTHDDLLKIMKPNTIYTMKAKAKVISRPSTILSHQYATMLLYRPGSSSLGSVVTPVLQMLDKETIALNTEKEYITTFTTPADLTDVRFLAYSFYGNNDGSTTGSAQGEIDSTEVMLAEGTYTTETFPEYEPYGVSPSPDYPSKINNVGEAINSFDIGELVKLSTDYSEVENGYIFMARLKMNTTGVTLKKPISLPASLSYTIKNGTGTNFRFKLWFDNDTSMSFDNYKSGTEADVIKNIAINNITQTGATKIIKITIDYSDAGTFTLTNFMINEGTTVKPYSPYGEGSINIKTHSGNYFDLSKYIGIPCVLNGTAIVTNTEITIKASSNNVTYTTIGLGNTGSVIAEAYRQYCMEIPEGANKLIVNFKNNNTARLASIYYNVLDENYRVLSGIPRIYNSTDEEGILQADININNAKYLLVRFDAATGGDVTYKNILLGKIDSYTPYEEQNKVITLAKPLYQDCYLAEDEIHYTRKQIVLDGSENWEVVASDQRKRFQLTLDNSKSYLTSQIPNIICNYFKANSADNIYKGESGIGFNGKVMWIDDAYGSTIDGYTLGQWKNWLANNPITLEYELAKEVIEPYTEEQKMAWNNMQNLISYLGTNNLISTANMDIKYPLRAKKKIIPTTYEKLLYIGYIDTYDFGELRETDVDNDINITLLSPMKLATLRTAIAIGTYTLKDLIESRILQPLIDDGFKLKEINITDRQVTVNFLSETIEYCMNNLSNKFNFWWYIDEKKNIHVKDISLMLAEKTDLIYDDTHRIAGLEYIKPITNSDDYANVINFKNVRIYEYSRLKLNGSAIVETHNPLIKKQLNDDVKKDNQIEFEFPVDINKNNIVKSAKSNGIIDTIIYGIYVKGTYSDNTTFSFFISYNTSNKVFETSENLGLDGEENEKEFLLIKDSFFGNLITGFKFNNENKNIKSIEEIRSDSALIWNTNKFYNDKGMLNKRGVISNTGIVELTLNMNESWKTIQELTEIGSSYLNKNSLNYADELEIKTDCDVFEVGNTIYINKFLIDGKYVITEIQQIYENRDAEYIVKCKSANMLSNFVDIFRGESSQESPDKTYQLYVTHYEEEGINERFEVVQ